MSFFLACRLCFIVLAVVVRMSPYQCKERGVKMEVVMYDLLGQLPHDTKIFY